MNVKASREIASMEIDIANCSLSQLSFLLQIVRVFYYLTAASLQYLTPVILLVFLALTLRTAGNV